MSRSVDRTGVVAVATVMMIVTGACAGQRASAGPRTVPGYVPFYTLENPTSCSTRTLGRVEVRDDHTRDFRELITREVQARGGNAAVDVVMERTPEETPMQPSQPTEHRPRYLSFSAAVVDWSKCKTMRARI